MKHTLKILSILLLGTITLMLSSCESEQYPFPDAGKVTLFTLKRTAGPGAFSDVTPTSTQISLALQKFEFGGDYTTSKVELCVVKNPNANDYKLAVLATITEQISLTTPTTVSFTVQQVLDATGGGNIEIGDDFVFFYRVYMPDGLIFHVWTKATGFNDSKPGAFVDLGISGAGRVQISAVCERHFSDFLGEWTYTTTWGNGPWFGTGGTLTAVEYPEKPGEGIIMTMTPGSWANPGNEGWNQPVKFTIDLDTYTWSWARQVVMIPWAAAGMTEVGINAGSGVINSCDAILVMTWTANVTNDAGGGWAGVAHRFAKVAP